MKFLQGAGPGIEWDKIDPLPENSVCNYTDLEDPNIDRIQEMLNKLVVIKLNGGLGTSMGCTGPKSVITVRNDLTFLDMTVQQIEVKLNFTFQKLLQLYLI